MSKKFIGNSLIKLGKKIVAVGKNYVAHCSEMGAKSIPHEPILFLKPTTSYIRDGESVVLPKGIGEVHHELELGVVIGRKASHVPERDWQEHVAGYVVALDITARSVQDELKESGLPWTKAKCWDTFTPISEFVPLSQVPAWDNLDLSLTVDGQERQRCQTIDMIFGVPFLLSYVSQMMTLEEGDMILCGTPSGVGPIFPGQVLTASINGLVQATFKVEEQQENHQRNAIKQIRT